MTREGWARGTFGGVPADEVEHFADGSNGLISRVFVLVADELIRRVDSAASKRGKGTVFVPCQKGIQAIEDGMVRAVNIDRVNVVPVRGEIDRVIGLDVDLATDGFHQGR